MTLKSKLASRKFWALIAALVTAALVARGASAGDVEHIVSVIGVFGAIVTYIAAEAAVDASNKKDYE